MIQMTATNIVIKTLARFREDQKISEIAKECKKQLKINVFKVIHLKVGDIIHRFSYFQQMYYRSNSQGDATEWKEDEKKVFLCFLVAFCRIYFRKVSEITNHEWEEVSKAFGNKDTLFLKYQGRVLQKCSQRVRWHHKEELFLQNYIKNSMIGKWAQISKSLFFDSEGRFSKTPKQCREHWFNHMDKQIKRGQWKIDQDLIILESVLDYGHKWARIVDLLTEKRTQHMIKNRFHSILTAFNKFTKQFKRCKNQRRTIKNLIKELSRKKKMMANYKKISLNQLSDQSIKSNLLQQQILPEEQYHSSSSNHQIKLQPGLEQQETPIQIENFQKIQENINMYQRVELSPRMIYPINPYVINLAESNILYGLNPYNSLLLCPMLSSYNDVYYNI